MDNYVVEQNLGLDTLAERMTVRRKDSDGIHLLSKMELMDMSTTAVAYEEYLPLLKLSYPNVASYTDIFTSVDHKISGTFVNLISDYFPKGNLDARLQGLRQEKKLVDRHLVDLWFGQMLEGLMYLWSQNIVHRNLKPESVYLREATNQPHGTLVIGDMLPASVAYDLRMRTRLPRQESLLARLHGLYSKAEHCYGLFLGTLSYTAPEVFASESYSVQSDIYSLGCILLDMITCETLSDEQTLQLRICARQDLGTLSETLDHLRKNYDTIPALIGQMMIVDPEKRLTDVHLRQHDYIVENMHKINSTQMKYPSDRDKGRSHEDLVSDKQLEYYLDYIQTHRNTESRVDYALRLCSQSTSIDLSTLAVVFHSDIIPVAEHYLSNRSIATNTLKLLAKVVDDEEVIGSHIIKFVMKLIPIYETDAELIGSTADVLISLAKRHTKLMIHGRLMAHLVQIMTKHEDNAALNAKCCTLLWLLAKDSSTKDLRENQVPIIRVLLTILQKHADNAGLFTKVCFAFLPLISQKSTLNHLVQFNLVRYFTIGLQTHGNDPHAIKAALAVLSELFKVDERCAMRFLCSRSDDGTLLDALSILNGIFDRFKDRSDIARGIVLLLKSMSAYDDAIDEMISTKIDDHLLHQIKRFHSDHQDIAQACEGIMKRIRQRSLLS